MACGGLRSCFWCVVKFVAFLQLSLLAKHGDWWHFLTEMPQSCSQERSEGIEVMILGLAKSGTRTICHALNELGIRAYHSEDFHFLPWWDLVRELRAGQGPYSNISMPEIARALYTDDQLLSQLMEKISRCGMEAVALDGLEVLLKPLAKANPNAKVIMLDWRTFPQWRKSLETFVPKLTVMCFHNVITGSSLGLMPWLALLRPLDSLTGGVVRNVLTTGGPPITEVGGPMVWLYHQSMNHRRQYECWSGETTTIDPQTQEDFDKFYAEVDTYYPKEQMFHWDPRRNTMEELCEFLGLSSCPKRGKVPRAINTWIFERDFPIAANSVIVLRLFLHWVNWKLFSAALALPCRRREKRD